MKSSPLARTLRRQQTEAEKRLWWFLRNRQVSNCKFRRQQAIASFTVDFFCIEKGLIVELDGGQHAEESEKEYDEARTNFFASKGYRTMRFWNHDVLTNTEGVLTAIQTVLNAPSSQPSPQGEGVLRISLPKGEGITL